jgi:hypothetical protein
MGIYVYDIFPAVREVNIFDGVSPISSNFKPKTPSGI